MAGKRLTSADAVERLASKSGLTVEQVKAVLQAQAELAYSNASQGFPVPGIGLFLITETPSRTMRISIGPKAGQEVTVPAKRLARFRLSRIAKTVAENPAQPIPDIFKPTQLPDLRYSTEAVELPDPSMFLGDLGTSFASLRDGEPVPLICYRLPDLRLTTGRIMAADGMILRGPAFGRSVPPGSYPLALAIARLGTDERVAFAILRFSDRRVAKWEMALYEGQGPAFVKEGEIVGYGVDSGTGSFGDVSFEGLVVEAHEEGIEFHDRVMDEMRRVHKPTRDWVHVESPKGSLAIFSSGWGDGLYASYFGLDDEGKPTALVTDFEVVNWEPAKGG